MSKPSCNGRQRPADAFLRVRRQLGEISARARAENDPEGGWPAIRSADRDAWPAIVEALRACMRTGKLHPLIATYLADAIAGGVAGKIPPGWPEPTGQRATLRADATPEDIASLYRKAGKMRLLSDRVHVKTILLLYGISKDQLNNWSRDYPAWTIVDGQHVALFTFGLSIYSKLGDIDQALLPLLKSAAISYRRKRRGIDQGGSG
jgi:hypothetical protein